ncbi:hypothetical protein PHYBLDRAFT_71833 [Phycomyces blakesleeanus NRRL 1555(-)]|uniref:Uncharacterized protein n=1 Tax=Phycomyces blakesleeanus (strain ATCC 8743b / DSM 1359 / FGSC 10004 / NBRC 33097 / NRRL 1555) TaxID=763407 RepID=A0A163DV66_PHYB8|nr:hypothetical protein PHYBLDRAFT_71833 [Phycomyces blakesleeanus NRRL 1555(-)]OAD73620.1 hypothetical protein PHYBLDRAFT_71833 [Phycomyces blakesleeanus NRRL 1555(-)]|eukprot:XP_018291660.1 hypothetical protein PHYBLDRAFT_71833 [Phycomyces blakesleeanus NRRL 1555(-)]
MYLRLEPQAHIRIYVQSGRDTVIDLQALDIFLSHKCPGAHSLLSHTLYRRVNHSSMVKFMRMFMRMDLWYSKKYISLLVLYTHSLAIMLVLLIVKAAPALVSPPQVALKQRASK